MHRDSVITPGIFQSLASIRDVYELNAQLARGFFKTARLVTQLSGE